MISEAVQSAGGESKLFSSIQKLSMWGALCQALGFPLNFSHWKIKKDIDIIEVNHTEGYKDNEGSGPHSMRNYWDAERNMCSVWRNQVQWLLSTIGRMGSSRGAGGTFLSGVHRKRMMGKRCQLHKRNTDWRKGVQYSQGSGQEVAQTVQRGCGFASSRAILECVQEPWVTWPCFTVPSALSKGWIK